MPHKPAFLLSSSFFCPFFFIVFCQLCLLHQVRAKNQDDKVYFPVTKQFLIYSQNSTNGLHLMKTEINFIKWHKIFSEPRPVIVNQYWNPKTKRWTLMISLKLKFNMSLWLKGVLTLWKCFVPMSHHTWPPKIVFYKFSAKIRWCLFIVSSSP